MKHRTKQTTFIGHQLDITAEKETWELFLVKARYQAAHVYKFRPGHTILLNDPDTIWIVYTGEVDVFHASIDRGEASGTRTHLFRGGTGNILMGMNTEDHPIGLLASGHSGTELLEISYERFIQLADDREFLPVLVELINNWIKALSYTIISDITPKESLDLLPRHPIELEPHQIVSPLKEDVWLKITEGALLYLGKSALRLHAPMIIPVSKHSWLESVSHTKLEVYSTTDFFQYSLDREKIEDFHQLVLRTITVNRQEAAEQERERLQQRSYATSRALHTAFSNLQAALGNFMVNPFRESLSDDPLFRALQTIGTEMNIRIHMPPQLSQSSLNTPLDEITRASRIRSRRVALAGRWWNRDNGPLLCYWESEEGDKQPVAAIPTSPSSYEIYDPATEQRTPVNEAVAENLAKFGHTFYPSFPNKALSMWELIRFGLRGYGRDVWRLLLAGIVIGILGTVTPFVSAFVFDNVIPEGDAFLLVQITVALLLAAIISALVQIIQNIAVLRIESKADGTLQSAMWSRLMELPIDFYRDYTAGDLAGRGMGISYIRETLSSTAIMSILGGIFSVFNLVLLFYYDVILALVAIVLVIIAIAFTSIAGYIQVKQLRVVTDIQGTISGYVLQFVNGISKFRVAGAEARAFSFWAEKFSRQKKLEFKARQTQNWVVVFGEVYPVLTSVVIFGMIVSARSVDLSIGEFVAFNTAFNLFLVSGLQLSTALTTVLAVIPTFERTKPIIETLPEVDESKVHPGELVGDIIVDNVSFRYRDDAPLAVKNVSLAINRSEFVALVGASGSGKSTLLRLMLGFEKPTAGAIYFDGQDLQDIDIRAVRQQIGVVLQNSQLMSGGDIASNILGTTTLTTDDAWEAARMVGVADDIKAMPMGMFTTVAEGGRNLSGGQRQRLLIARAIVSRPRILFFDEATSALDNHTQSIVSESLNRLDATRVVIAHRLSTIINADRIFVMYKGELVQVGSYEELMREVGPFADLAKRQLV